MRLPRDWLGPREDLIPFGPSAEAAGDGLATPPSTHDFWGEGAGDPWQPEPSGAETAPTRGRRRRLVGLAVLAPLAVACAVVMVLGLGAGPGGPPLPSAVVARLPIPAGNLTPGLSLPSLARPRAHLASARSSSRAARRRGKQPAQRHRARRGGRPRAGRTAAAQTVSYRKVPAANPRPAASPAASPTPPPSPPPTAPAPASATPQAAAAQSSGSTHPSALGAGGQLAPGSSPDS